MAYNDIGSSPGSEGQSSGRGNNQNFSGHGFTPSVDLTLEGAGVGVYDYEGVPISVYDYGNLGRFEFLPDASLFRDPVTGGILNVNAEYWIYRAGGSDVPWWGDPVNWVTFGTSPLRRGFAFDVSPGKIEPFHIGLKTLDASRRNLLHFGYHKRWGAHIGIGYTRAARGWTTWKHIYFYPPRIWP